jgi:hypothetical protein
MIMVLWDAMSHNLVHRYRRLGGSCAGSKSLTSLHICHTSRRHVEEALMWILTLVKTSCITQFCFKITDNLQNICVFCRGCIEVYD